MYAPCDDTFLFRDRAFVICESPLDTDTLSYCPSSLTLASSSAGLPCKKRILLRPFLSPPVVLCNPPCVTWVTSSVQVECLQKTTTMSNTTADGDDDEVRTTSPHSPLASQRGKAGNTSTETNSKGRTGGYFTLGYKEGFSQWVRKAS